MKHNEESWNIRLGETRANLHFFKHELPGVTLSKFFFTELDIYLMSYFHTLIEFLVFYFTLVALICFQKCISNVDFHVFNSLVNAKSVHRSIAL